MSKLAITTTTTTTTTNDCKEEHDNNKISFSTTTTTSSLSAPLLHDNSFSIEKKTENTLEKTNFTK